MKKYLTFILIGLFSIVDINVYACGEIKSLTSDVGTVSVLNDTFYQVAIPEGTKEVTLLGDTDYTWVEGYGPRKVSTSETAQLRVDGNSCGYGIYTYYVEFKTISNIIAENEPTTQDNNQSVQTPPLDGVITEPTPDTTSDYGSLLLDILNIKEALIEFDPQMHEYAILVESDVESLTIKAISNNPNVTITVSDNANKLKVGTNTINITLADAEGNTGMYIITVDKLKPKSNNNFLASLKIDGYPINFDPSITEYTVSIGKKVMMLTIDAVSESELADVETLGNMNLSDGSVVTVRVTAEDGSSKDYILHIEKKFNLMDYIYYIIAGVLVVVLIILLLLIRKSKRKPKPAGPQAMEAQKETAGAVQEIGSQNAISNDTPVETLEVNSGAQAELKMLEPTNIETPKEEPKQEDGSTEVFSL